MGLMDKLKKAAADHGDKIEKGIDKAAGAAAKRSPKQASKVEQVAEKAKSAVDNLADEKRKPRDPEPPPRTKP